VDGRRAGLAGHHAGPARVRPAGQALATEGRIELRGFGVFEVKKRKARKARNPRTGEAVLVPETSTVSFKAGREIQERVGKLKDVPARDGSSGV
jgi:integration host factor subunit beta